MKKNKIIVRDRMGNTKKEILLTGDISIIVTGRITRIVDHKNNIDYDFDNTSECLTISNWGC